MGRGAGPAIDEVATLARLFRKEAFRGVAELSGVGRGRGRERSIDRALEMPTSGWPCSLLHYKRLRHIFDLLASEHSRALLPRTSLASSHHSTSKRRGLRRCCCCSLHSCRHQLKNTNQPTQFELFLIPHFSDPSPPRQTLSPRPRSRPDQSPRPPLSARSNGSSPSSSYRSSRSLETHRSSPRSL